MEYIRKEKNANRYKLIESIDKFTVADFDKYELYETNIISKERYGDVLKEKKISQLKKELEALGVYENPIIQNAEDNDSRAPSVTNDYNTESKEKHAKNGAKEVKNTTTNVVNKATGKKFTYKELEDHFQKFKEQIEKDIQEVVFSSFDENGFIISVTEIRKDLPSIFPNGIPLKQIIC